MFVKQFLLSAIWIAVINQYTTALELTLDPEVKSVSGDRTTCGVLRCVEEGGPPRVDHISSMTVYKSTGPWSKRGRTSIAFVSERQASTSSFWDGVKVDGIWTQRRAEITLHLVEPDDCRHAEFSCEVRSVNAEGLESVSSSKVGWAGSTQDTISSHQPAQESCSVGLGTLQLNAILQQTFSALENRLEDCIQNLGKQMEDKLSGIGERLVRLESKTGPKFGTNNDIWEVSISELMNEMKSVSNNIALLGEKMTSNVTNNEQIFIGEDLERASFITSLEAIVNNQTLDILSHTHNSTGKVIDTIGEVFKKRDCIRSSFVRQDIRKALESDYHVVWPQNGAAQYLCDVYTDGGGWVVIQRRVNGAVDFYRDWASYKEGFGTLDTEFWMGNERIHALTAEAPHELMVGLVYNGTWKYARYNVFRVGNETSGYKLEVDGYSGTAGEALRAHNNMKFSTHDRDNDKSSETNCAKYYTGAWWHHSCLHANLNGKWGKGSHRGPQWWPFTGARPAVFTELKIRRL